MSFYADLSFFFLLGACLGSFLNVVIIRWPKGESFVSPRSRCGYCGEPIPFYFNVPILSWFFLLGKTRCCNKPLSFQYPLVELLAAVLFAFTFYLFGWSFKTFEMCLFVFMALPCFVIDLKHYLLPDIFTFPGMALGVLGSFWALDRTPMQSVMGLALGGGAFWFISWFYEKFRNQEGMGFGDVKLIAWLGALGGVASLPFVIFASSFFGALVGVFMIVFKSGNRETAIPFGPFLITAGFLYFYFTKELGAFLSNWFFIG